MVSRIGYVQVRNTRLGAVVEVFVLVAVVGLITQSFADDTKVHDKRQLENEWASTSKKNHKGPNTYEFRYDVENAPTNNIQYRMEERHPNGSVVGSYGQVQPDGKIRVVSYVADKEGVKTYVKDNGGVDQYVAEGSSLDPVQRVTSQIIETAVKSQPHKSPLYDKYHRPTPSTAAAAGQRVDSAHSYHQQRTNIDPATFRPEDSPGFQETNQPFVGDQLKDKLQSSYAEYQVAPNSQLQPTPQQLAQNSAPLPPVVPYSLQQGAMPAQQPSHYVLNVPPLPALADNSPLPLLPGQQPLPITPDRGPIMIQLQQPQQQQPPVPLSNYQQQQHYQQYPPAHSHQQQLRLPQGQQQLLQPSQVQQYQQQPVRVQPPVHLQQQVQLMPHQQQAVQYQPQQARVVPQHALPPQNIQQQQQQQQQQTSFMPANSSNFNLTGNSAFPALNLDLNPQFNNLIYPNPLVPPPNGLYPYQHQTNIERLANLSLGQDKMNFPMYNLVQDKQTRLNDSSFNSVREPMKQSKPVQPNVFMPNTLPNSYNFNIDPSPPLFPANLFYAQMPQDVNYVQSNQQQFHNFKEQNVQHMFGNQKLDHQVLRDKMLNVGNPYLKD